MFAGNPKAPRQYGGAAEPHLAGFNQYLEERGYARPTIVLRVRAATHLGLWMQRKGLKAGELTDPTLNLFIGRLSRYRRPKWRKEQMAGARLFAEYLRRVGIIAPRPPKAEGQPRLLQTFRQFMLQHRGARARTVDGYCRLLHDLLRKLGEEAGQWQVSALRQFVVERGRPHGSGQAQNIATAVRVFLRYLVATGQCRAGLEGAIPPVASWRLSALPRYLPVSDVDRILDTCQVETPVGLRDRAILLLLCRLGLRANEVKELCLGDVHWKEGSFVVAGKGRRRDRLPLPQEVGDAILAYLERGRPTSDSDHLFLRARAPRRPFLDSTAVSSIVCRAIHRAQVTAPSHGAHVLRHSAATQMLRNGSSLEAIAKVLRHCSLETTAHYAKVDIALLKEIAQPWPEVAPC